MRRIAVFGLAVAVLALTCGRAFADGWTSKTPANQPVGPKYGDYLKNGKINAPQPSDKRPQQGKKKKSG
jgi:hypothetical protein